MSTVRIVATIGPKTDNRESLTAMREAGMNIARLNGSHGDLSWHERTVELLHNAVPDIPILLDIPGPKVRVTNLKHELNVLTGSRVVITGDRTRNEDGVIAVDNSLFHHIVSVNDEILIDDGSMHLTVSNIDGEDVICQAKHPGVILNGKGVHLPGTRPRSQFLVEKDHNLISLAVRTGIDFIGASFVSAPSDVHMIKEAIGNGSTQIISKIETAQAVENMFEIAELSDGLMIDRGDLSVDTNIEGVAILQKIILSRANKASRPVIVATELLQSMINNPVPTKAEIGDITNSVLDRASALMLSAETAVGQYPVESIRVMRSVADKASAYLQQTLDSNYTEPTLRVPQAIASAIALICRDLAVTKIVAITKGGTAARMVSAQMPSQPILAVTNDVEISRKFNLFPGTKGIYVDVPFSKTSMEHIPNCLKILWQRGELVDEDLILVTAVGYPKSGNRMNLLETHLVGDLRQSLSWS